MTMRLALLLLAPTAAAGGSVLGLMPTEEIDLDLPPEERWVKLAHKYHDSITGKCQFLGKMFRAALGEETAERLVKSAPLDATMIAEYDSIVKAVNDRVVTRSCLILTDMWQAVNSPIFGCSAILAAMDNGTVIHGRNIDYDTVQVAKSALKYHVSIGKNSFIEISLKRGGKPIASMLVLAGGLGTHTGMRLGGYSVNSNARLLNNKVALNLQAQEAGAKNFPWVLRNILETVPDWETAVKTIEDVSLNAPNYFILAGAGPWQGAIVTKDRLGTHEPSTPPTQRLDPAKGVWYLVQTNDDLLSPAEDSRRDSALNRLAKSRQSQVSMAFVEGEMRAEPITNSDTLLTWVGNPLAGTHKVFMRDVGNIAKGFLSKALHRTLHMDMPQDLSKAQKAKNAK